MHIISKLIDQRIDAINIQVEILASEYIKIANSILDSNEFQRKRVKSSGSIYSLLKSDILEGCLIPPIVLASKITEVPNIEEIDDNYLSEKILGNVPALIILDGLQRTHSLLEVFDEAKDNKLVDYIIRLEIYLNITEVGILYRMLTLNAGQTPMSLRHQIEILYSNYAGSNIGEINIIRQIDDTARKSERDYNYSDLIEGYNSYLERNESPIDRFSLLDIVQSIEKISTVKDDSNSFTNFTKTYYQMVKHFQTISCGWEYPKEENDIPSEYSVQGNPFGTTAYKIFNRTQALTGFGAAIGSLIDQEVIQKMEDIIEFLPKIKIGSEKQEFFHINRCLDEVKQGAKKIGNAQRLFFRYFFKNFFDITDSEYFLNFISACDVAKNRTIANI